MPTFKERFTDFLLGDERRRLQESAQILYNAYLEGPFQLPPDQLVAQLKEQDSALLTDLIHQLYWEQLGTPGYGQNITAERSRAIDESRRLWKYNPLAQWMINLWTNYGFGENIAVQPEDEAAAKVWDEFWTADRNQAILAADKIADKLSNWLLVDGDRFLTFYGSTVDGETTVRRINTKEIVEIITDPDDANTPLFYKRQWTTPQGKQLTWYYPDWEAFFRGDEALGKAKLPANATRADQENKGTTVCILHIPFNSKDEDTLFGWPLLAAGSPWIRSQKRHLENRLAVSAAKAMYVRRAKVSGGSRAVDNVIANLRSALSSTQRTETNPPSVAGSTLVENQAVDTTDLPMTTGAADAKTDGEMFSWMALISGGVFPHYAGMGDAYRLATATAMEAPIQRQFSRYQVFWSAQFRKMLRIVLQMKEEYGGVSFSTYEAEVSTDKLVEVDLDGMSMALGRVFETIVNPMSEMGAIPGPVVRGVLQAALTTVLQALGVDAEQIVGDEAWPEPEGEEEGELEEAVFLALQNWRDGLIDADDLVAFLVPARLEEGGPGSGWFAPPKGTHVAGAKAGPKKPKMDRAGKAPKGPDTTGDKADYFLARGLEVELEGLPAYLATLEAKQKAKDEIVTELAKRTGTSYEEMNLFIKQWAHTSGNDDMRSLAIQTDAAKEFEVVLSDHIKRRMAERKYEQQLLFDKGITDRPKEAGEDQEIWDSTQPLMESKKQRTILKAMYENTQEKLRDVDFEPTDYIRLRRGVKLPLELTKDWKEDDIVSIEGNPLESWATNVANAMAFANGRGKKQRGIVLEMDIPIESIISTARTGFGCLEETEFVTIGIEGDAKVAFIYEAVS